MFARFGGARSNVPILLDDVICIGNEERLLDCDASDIGVHDCTHRGDAGVVCVLEGGTAPAANSPVVQSTESYGARWVDYANILQIALQLVFVLRPKLALYS